MKIKILSMVHAALSDLTTIFTLSALSFVGALAGLVYGWRVLAASAVLALAAIGLGVANIALNLGTCGALLIQLQQRFQAWHDEDAKTRQQSAASAKPN